MKRDNLPELKSQAEIDAEERRSGAIVVVITLFCALIMFLIVAGLVCRAIF